MVFIVQDRQITVKYLKQYTKKDLNVPKKIQKSTKNA